MWEPAPAGEDSRDGLGPRPGGVGAPAPTLALRFAGTPVNVGASACGEDSRDGLRPRPGGVGAPAPTFTSSGEAGRAKTGPRPCLWGWGFFFTETRAGSPCYARGMAVPGHVLVTDILFLFLFLFLGSQGVEPACPPKPSSISPGKGEGGLLPGLWEGGLEIMPKTVYGMGLGILYASASGRAAMSWSRRQGPWWGVVAPDAATSEPSHFPC